MQRRTFFRIRRWLTVTVAGGIVGVCYSYLLSLVNDYPFVLAEYRISLLSGLSVAGLAGLAEIFWFRTRRGAWVRRQPMWIDLSIRLATHFSLVFLALLANRQLHGTIEGADVIELWPANALARDMVFSIAGLMVFLFVMQMTSLVGARNLINLLIGRYHRPVSVERIFLFLDMERSTQIARDLGDAGFHRYLSNFFFDCDDILVNAGGEVYSYVGDAVIVVWPLSTPQRNARPVRAVMELRNHIADLAPKYTERFGHAPGFRCAMHGGAVVTGECGDTRQQITYLGDVVNVTARLEQVAKTSGQAIVVTQELLSRIDLPEGVIAVDEGSHAFKGVDEPVQVFALQPA